MRLRRARFISDRATFQEARRIADVDFKVGNEATDDTSGARYGTVTEDGAGEQDGLGTDPGSVPDLNGGDHKAEGGVAPVVIAGAEIGSLADADVAAETDGSEVIDPAALADPAVITDDEVPGILDVDGGFDDDARADARSEGTQERDPQGGGWNEGAAQNGLAEEEPGGALED